MIITTTLYVCTRARRVRLSLVLLITLVAVMLTPRAARGDPAPQPSSPPSASASLTIDVLVQNLTDVSTGELKQAMTIASNVYQRIGVGVRWYTNDENGEPVPTDENEKAVFCQSLFFVSLLPQRALMTLQPRPTPTTLGMAAPGTRFARVLVQPVRMFAASAGINAGRLLGYVIAHELGHLLLPAQSHSAAGLMAAILPLDLARLGELWFDEDQAGYIRRTIARRQVPPVTSGTAVTSVTHGGAWPVRSLLYDLDPVWAQRWAPTGSFRSSAKGEWAACGSRSAATAASRDVRRSSC